MADPGNRISTALDVGSLIGQFSFADSVNRETDTSDFYRVTLTRSSRLNAAFIGTGNVVSFRLIRDFNNNDVTEFGEAIQTAIPGPDQVVSSDLPIGTYFIQVSMESGLVQSRNDYTLTLTNTPVGTLSVDPGNRMSQALDIGIFNRSRTFADFVGSPRLDPADYYRFTLDRPTNISLTLAGTSNDTGVLLIQDLNNNDVVENNEIIARTSSGSTGSGRSQPTSINQTLQPGTYFVNLSTFNDQDSNYTLNFFTPGATGVPFGLDGLFFNLSTDGDTITINPAQVGNLSVRGLDGDDVIQGTSSNDVMNGNVGNDILLGGDGNDLLRGGKNNDLLFGGEGNDQLVGDFGQDILTGNAGNDLFILRVNTSGTSVADADVIADFTAGQDAIALTNGLGFAEIALDALGSNTAIRIVATGQILGVVSGVQPTALSAGNFTTLPGDF